MPVGDIMLTQKIILETDEEAALVIANRTLGTVTGIVRFHLKESAMENKREPQPMKEPMKPHGDKIDVDKGDHKTVKDQKGKQPRDDTARVGGAAYAPHDLEAEKLAENTGDNRTPDKTIGEIKYARQPDKKQGEDK